MTAWHDRGLKVSSVVDGDEDDAEISMAETIERVVGLDGPEFGAEETVEKEGDR